MPVGLIPPPILRPLPAGSPGLSTGANKCSGLRQRAASLSTGCPQITPIRLRKVKLLAYDTRHTRIFPQRLTNEVAFAILILMSNYPDQDLMDAYDRWCETDDWFVPEPEYDEEEPDHDEVAGTAYRKWIHIR